MSRLFVIVVLMVLTGCSVNEPVETQHKPSTNGEELEIVFDTIEVSDSISLN